MRIEFQVQPPDAQLVLDGRLLEAGVAHVLLPLDGMPHLLEVSARGYEPVARTFAVSGPEKLSIELEPKLAVRTPLPTAPVRPKRPAPARVPAAPAASDAPDATATAVKSSSAAAATLPPDCESPFFVDEQGIRRVRRECW
jgi:hypothetical protein